LSCGNILPSLYLSA